LFTYIGPGKFKKQKAIIHAALVDENVYSTIVARIRDALHAVVEKCLQKWKKEVLSVVDQIEADLNRSTAEFPAGECEEITCINRLAGSKLGREISQRQKELKFLLEDIESLEISKGLDTIRVIQYINSEFEKTDQSSTKAIMKRGRKRPANDMN
jgi:hypothetical protein